MRLVVFKFSDSFDILRLQNYSEPDPNFGGDFVVLCGECCSFLAHLELKRLQSASTNSVMSCPDKIRRSSVKEHNYSKQLDGYMA